MGVASSAAQPSAGNYETIDIRRDLRYDGVREATVELMNRMRKTSTQQIMMSRSIQALVNDVNHRPKPGEEQARMTEVNRLSIFLREALEEFEFSQDMPEMMYSWTFRL